MPKSKVRKKSDYTAPTRSSGSSTSASNRSSTGRQAPPSPTWYPIVMAVVLGLGLAWIAVYYIAAERVPFMQDIGAANFAIGFGLMVLGLIMAVRWR